jgi:hypothetical protein
MIEISIGDGGWFDRSIVGVDGTLSGDTNSCGKEETGASKFTKGAVAVATGLESTGIFFAVFLATIITYYLPK